MSSPPLRRADLDPDPLRQFAAWYSQAVDAVDAPEAVVLATATSSGAPSARMVLLKGFDQRGFVFYTNYFSRKGQEIAQNPRAAMLFHWSPLGRQVRVEGAVHRIDAAESDAYFKTRPGGSRLSAAASPQSRPVAGREVLETAVSELASRYPDGAVPRPEEWGGLRLVPSRFEFWQHGDDRLHDRFTYRREGEAWTVERLGP
ncbi:MAG TPA: pyridoxamine 5'-phosphate oxidase [Gaiellales bacterium]|nr:pyridoxamine 5'-phosphate oxidase [Gaiellales bacterium]